MLLSVLVGILEVIVIGWLLWGLISGRATVAGGRSVRSRRSGRSLRSGKSEVAEGRTAAWAEARSRGAISWAGRTSRSLTAIATASRGTLVAAIAAI